LAGNTNVRGTTKKKQMVGKSSTKGGWDKKGEGGMSVRHLFGKRKCYKRSFPGGNLRGEKKSCAGSKEGIVVGGRCKTRVSRGGTVLEIRTAKNLGRLF